MFKITIKPNTNVPPNATSDTIQQERYKIKDELLSSKCCPKLQGKDSPRALEYISQAKALP